METPCDWVIEADVFRSRDAELQRAVEARGGSAVAWRDEWWDHQSWPRLQHAVVFHGSLGNAARIARELPWRPGAFCHTHAFHCSAWYPQAERWLVHREWTVLPASRLVADPSAEAARVGSGAEVFVRPDSPLKPFSGRVLPVRDITLAALDHGYYFDDPHLAVVVAAKRAVGREWRYVVVDRRVVAGSRYAADGRTALPDDPTGEPWAFAAAVAAELTPPEPVYVLDICEDAGELRLLELNPFSGADLYACDATAVVTAVSAAAIRLAGA